MTIKETHEHEWFDEARARASELISQCFIVSETNEERKKIITQLQMMAVALIGLALFNRSKFQPESFNREQDIKDFTRMLELELDHLNKAFEDGQLAMFDLETGTIGSVQ